MSLSDITLAFSPIGSIRTRLPTFGIFERCLLSLFIALSLTSGFLLLVRMSRGFLVEVPVSGGTLREGVVGSPRFANPLLALSDADRDLTALVYAGLMKTTPAGGLEPDLARSYEISDDGLNYTFSLRDDAFFHDGEPVTADDVVYTIQMVQDNRIKSPKRPNWEGVSVQKINDHEVLFSLREPYAPFLENTTLGILPRHIWKSADPEQFSFSQYNVEPVGAGPYRVTSVKRNSAGVPISYILAPFRKYTLGKPFISELILKFYANETALLTALEQGAIDSVNSISPERVAKLPLTRSEINHRSLPRIFAVFFNQNQQPIFVDHAVRRALDHAVDKQGIVEHILDGFGTPIESPLPPSLSEGRDDPSLEGNEENPEKSSEPSLNRIAEAALMLEGAGWKKNAGGVFEKTTKQGTEALAFTLATSDIPELKSVATILRETWKQMGTEVTVQIFDVSDLNHAVIRPRKYDALLFGEIVGRDLDLFAFWHSSQRADPGLNVALYANITVDKLLEDARRTIDDEKRLGIYTVFEKEIRKDIPAIFLYAPDFIYLTPRKLQGVTLGDIATPADRFFSVHRWFLQTERVLPIFAE